GGFEGRKSARAAAAPSVRRAADAGTGRPHLGERRSRRARRGAGDRSAAVELCGGPSGAVRIVGGNCPCPRPNSLLGVSWLCAIGPTVAESAATGRARRTGADVCVMTACDLVC